MEFVNKHHREMIALEPRFEPLETPIEDPKKEQNEYGWIHTKIKVDESRQS
tara:strand:+ start:412 stop:564 length:153 start_codon:yes stop_codon:yes gene_type:complete